MFLLKRGVPPLFLSIHYYWSVTMSNIRKVVGSRWWKFDFHSHTPKSKDYTEQEIGFSDLLLKYMDQSVDCLVITDHNSGEAIDEIKNALNNLRTSNAQSFRELIIFPGIEITTSDGCHVLAVLDPSVTSAHVSALLGSCGINDNFGYAEKVATTSFAETVKKIEGANGIPIATHIDGPKGLLHTQRAYNPSLKQSLENIYAIEVCNSNFFEGCEYELKQKLKKCAHVCGSDSHSRAEVGRNGYVWINLSSQTIESLRLSLMDGELSVKFGDDPNFEPPFYISNLKIAKTKYCGRVDGAPFEIAFSPQLNSLVGGRGTGKSTCIEAIRLALGRDDELGAFANLHQKYLSFVSLETKTAGGIVQPQTNAEVVYWRRGSPYKVVWKYGSNLQLEELRDGQWSISDSKYDSDRFPVSIYSQKQINEISKNPTALLHVIDRSNEVNKEEWDTIWNESQNEFMQLRLQVRILRQQISSEETVKAKLKDVTNDLKRYEEQGHGDILKKYQYRNQQIAALKVPEELKGLPEKLNEFAEYIIRLTVKDVPYQETDVFKTQLSQIVEAVNQEINKLAASVQSASGIATSLIDNYKNSLLLSEWYKDVTNVNYSYNALLEEYKGKGGAFDPNQYGQWVEMQGQLQNTLNAIDDKKTQLASLEKKTSEKYEILFNLRGELHRRRAEFVEKVLNGNKYVRMSIIPFGEVSFAEMEFRDILGVDSTKFSSSILDRDRKQGLLWEFVEWESASLACESLPTVIHKIKMIINDVISNIARPEYIHGSLVKNLQDRFSQHPEFLDNIWTWWPEDLLKVEFSTDDRGSRFQSLNRGSEGQKAAAILAFLLSYGEEPLIIDQPEDDLDNALIYTLIVKQIREIKHKRQVILVTHNPNIVVNGDSELVHVLEFRGGQICAAASDGLQDKEIRDSICRIMEGGQEAFRKRFERIGRFGA